MKHHMVASLEVDPFRDGQLGYSAAIITEECPEGCKMDDDEHDGDYDIVEKCGHKHHLESAGLSRCARKLYGKLNRNQAALNNKPNEEERCASEE